MLKELLLKARCSKCWTQTKMAKMIGISYGTYIKAEQGHDIGFISKSKIARYLVIDIKDLR